MLRLLSSLVLLFFWGTQKAHASCSDFGFLILRSSAVKERIYYPFLQNTCVQEGRTAFGLIDYNPLTANQPRDLAQLLETVKELSVQAPRGIIILAYSETGKFAAKLASLNSEIRALFLMDPVDGTPPFSSSSRFPIFLDENFPVLKIPVTILESELGPKFKRLGHSCVPLDMGPQRFYRHVEPDALTRVYMEKFGHADFLKRENLNIVEIMCGTGPEANEVSFPRVLLEWTRFLEQVVPELN